jgi:hypothetical protein
MPGRPLNPDKRILQPTDAPAQVVTRDELTAYRKTAVRIKPEEVADGTISAFEFLTLGGASSNIQAQIDAISSSKLSVGVSELESHIVLIALGAAQSI